MNDLVSVIVPAFNAEAYLERCLGSVLGQSHGNLQVILVNDGSADGTAALCESLAGRDKRIEVIHRENGGVSAARNTGLAAAKGDWIAFLDVDDYYAPEFIACLLALCKKYGARCAACHYAPVYEGPTEKTAAFTTQGREELLEGRQAVLAHFGKRADVLNLSWNKLYGAELWQGLRFPEGKTNEDLFVSHRLLYTAGPVVLSRARLYAYSQTQGSIMRSPFCLQRLDALAGYCEGVRYFEEQGEEELAAIARRVYYNRLLDAAGLVKRHLPQEAALARQLRRQAAMEYRGVRGRWSYEDLRGTELLLYKGKQWLGRYCPHFYQALFLKDRTYV